VASLRFRRTSPSTIANGPGNQKAAAAKWPPDVDPWTGFSSLATIGALVLTVSVSVTGPLPAAIIKLGGAKVHDTCAGKVPHEKLIVPV
jgi:hypothetical protein